MPQPKAIEPSRKLTLQMPPALMTRLELYLTSTAMGRVPKGAWSKFFCDRTEEFFARLATPTTEETQ
jgi:hypothetical protein